MRALWVLYDEHCAFCVRCAKWLERQPAFVSLKALPAGAPATRRTFGAALREGAKQELLVIADDGSVWREDEAWLMCLWALEDWREWSLRFARPSLRPLARNLFEMVSTRRGALSRWLEGQDDETIGRTLRHAFGPPESPKCADDRCDLTTGVDALLAGGTVCVSCGIRIESERTFCPKCLRSTAAQLSAPV